MAFSQREFSGNGVTSQFEIPFLFISPEDIRVSLNEEPLVFEQDYEIVETDQGFFVNFYEAPVSSDVGMIYRITSPEKRLVQWRAPSPFKEDDLNLEANQFLFRLQELTDRVDADGFVPSGSTVIIDDEEISKTLLEDAVKTGNEASSLIADLEAYTDQEISKIRADIQGVQDQAQSEVQSARDNLEGQIEDAYNTLQDAINSIESDVDPDKYATNAELEENYYTFEQVDAAIAAKETQLTSQLTDQFTDGVLDDGFWSDDGIFFEDDEWNDFSNDVRFVEATLDQSYLTITEVDQALTALEANLTSEYQVYVDNELENYYTKATIDNGFYTKASADQAIAAQIQSFDAEVEGGLKASVETHKSAIAELDDFASAFASVTVDTEGGGIAGFRAVSYENADGSGSSALELLGDQVVVPGSLTSRSLTVTDGSGNLIINGDFLSGDDRGWQYRGDNPPYFAKYSDEVSGATEEDVVPSPYMFVFSNTDSGGIRSETFKVKPGDDLIAAFDYGAGGDSPRNVSFRVAFRFLDPNGDYLEGQEWSDYSPSYSDVGWADRYSTTTTVPEGAAYCNVQFSRDPDTADEGTGFLTNLECRRREDGRTIIKPGSVTTEEIDTDDFNANGMAVFGGQLVSDNFESGVSGWSIWNDGSAEFDTIHLRDGAVTAQNYAFVESSSELPTHIIQVTPEIDLEVLGSQGVFLTGSAAITSEYSGWARMYIEISYDGGSNWDTIRSAFIRVHDTDRTYYGQIIIISHVYLSPGTYTFRLSAEDEFEGDVSSVMGISNRLLSVQEWKR